MKYLSTGTDIHGQHSNDFGDPLTFNLAPSTTSQIYYLSSDTSSGLTDTKVVSGMSGSQTLESAVWFISLTFNLVASFFCAFQNICLALSVLSGEASLLGA